MLACSSGKRVRLTDRDLVWLAALHRHGPLPSSFLLGFGAPKGKSFKRAQERLGDLFHEDNSAHGGAHLIRPAQQFQTLDSRYNQLVYDLAPAGIKALKACAAWSDTSGPQGGPWWHKLMISSITASIELSTINRPDLSFIPRSKILERAGAKLERSVRYVDPASNKTVEKVLKPDALFGLEYRGPNGSRFRFYVVEADRATEPLTTKALNRKSAARSFAQYQAYVERGLYKQHLNLTAPLLVLNVTTSEARREQLIKALIQSAASGSDYMLFQHWDAFSVPPRIPNPNGVFLSGNWHRAERGLLRIDRS